MPVTFTVVSPLAMMQRFRGSAPNRSITLLSIPHVIGLTKPSGGGGEYAELMDPDEATRAVLAKVIRATAEAGHPACVTISNHAEGSAPLSVRALAREIVTPAGSST